MACPHCGAPDPVGTKAAAESDRLLRRRWGIAAALGLFLVIAIGVEMSDNGPTPPGATGSTDARTAIDVRPILAADSQLALGVLSGATHSPRDSMDAEVHIHVGNLPIPHAALHRRVIAMLLDSMRAVIAADRDSSDVVTQAKLYNDDIYPPITPAQDAERRKLLSRAQALEPLFTVAARTAFASEYQDVLLRNYNDAYVAATGRAATTLRIRYILMSRPVVYNIVTNDTVMTKLRALGFTRLVLTDGDENTWTWDMVKEQFIQ